MFFISYNINICNYSLCSEDILGQTAIVTGEHTVTVKVKNLNFHLNIKNEQCKMNILVKCDNAVFNEANNDIKVFVLSILVTNQINHERFVLTDT